MCVCVYENTAACHCLYCIVLQMNATLVSRRACNQMAIGSDRSLYLSEGQAVFVLVFVFDLEVVESFALRRRLGQRPDALDVTGWKESVAAV